MFSFHFLFLYRLFFICKLSFSRFSIFLICLTIFNYIFLLFNKFFLYFISLFFFFFFYYFFHNTILFLKLLNLCFFSNLSFCLHYVYFNFSYFKYPFAFFSLYFFLISLSQNFSIPLFIFLNL